MSTELSNPTRTHRVIAFAWLFLLTLALALDHVVLTHEMGDARTYADRDALAATQNQVGAVQSRLESLADQKPVSQADFEAAGAALKSRLESVERAASSNLRADALTPLLDRILVVEKQLSTLRRSTLAAKRVDPPATSEKPVLQEPPFSVIGVELRGGERFLSVAPVDAQSSRPIRLMRPGDAEGQWRLDGIDATGAQFTVDGVVRRLSVR